MAFEDVWNGPYEGLPADNENINLGAGRIRDLKVNIRERANIDHSWGDTLDNGQHNQVTFNVSSGDPTASGSNAFLYTKTVGGNSELFFEDSSGDVLQVTNRGTSGTLTGEIKIWPLTSAPSGWLLCNGANVSRTAYSALFAIIGTTFGAGDGSTTFTLPDTRGRVIAGYDAGNATGRLTGDTSQGVSASTIGTTGGEQDHTLQIVELASHNHSVSITDPQHTHGVTDPQHNHGVTDPQHSHAMHTYSESGTNNAPAVGGNIQFGDINTQSASTGISILNHATGVTVNTAATGITAGSGNTGSGQAHNNVQPTLIINYIIKT